MNNPADNNVSRLGDDVKVTALHVDIDEALKRLGKKSLYLSILKKFKGREMVDELTALVKSGNEQEAKNSAHTLKGVAANLSLKVLWQSALDIEQRIKNGEKADELLPGLEIALNETIECIRILMENEGMS